MTTQTKTEVMRRLETRYNVIFTPVSGKKVFFDNENRTIVVCSPHSKTHKGGQGWIDLTKIQIDLMEEYDSALFAFRLPGQQTYFINFKQIRPLLTEECIFYNQKEGEHWKLYVWPERIEVRQNNTSIPIVSNTFENIEPIFRI